MKVFIRSYVCIIAAALIVQSWTGLSWSESGSPEPPGRLTASMDRDSAPVGSIVSLSLAYQLPEGATLPEEREITGLEEMTVLDRIHAPGKIIIKLLVDRLDTWQTGTLSLAYVDKEGEARSLATEPVSLKVLSNLGEKPEEAELRPIQGIIPTQAWIEHYLPWLAGVLGLVLTAGGFIWWRCRRRGGKTHGESDMPAHIRAMRELEQLEADRLFEQGQLKGFYFRFSEILRRYLESLRGFPAAEFTTEEIASAMDNETDRQILPLLREADLVKFADAMPTQARKEDEVRKAVAYIQETSPVPEAD